jgi:hypothetical protein
VQNPAFKFIRAFLGAWRYGERTQPLTPPSNYSGTVGFVLKKLTSRIRESQDKESSHDETWHRSVIGAGLTLIGCGPNNSTIRTRPPILTVTGTRHLPIRVTRRTEGGSVPLQTTEQTTMTGFPGLSSATLARPSSGCHLPGIGETQTKKAPRGSIRCRVLLTAPKPRSRYSYTLMRMLPHLL